MEKSGKSSFGALFCRFVSHKHETRRQTIHYVLLDSELQELNVQPVIHLPLSVPLDEKLTAYTIPFQELLHHASELLHQHS